MTIAATMSERDPVVEHVRTLLLNHCASGVTPSHMTALVSAYDKAMERVELWRENVRAYSAAFRMIREAIEHYGPVGVLCSEDAELRRGPEPHHTAEALIEGIGRIRTKRSELSIEWKRHTPYHPVWTLHLAGIDVGTVSLWLNRQWVWSFYDAGMPDSKSSITYPSDDEAKAGMVERLLRNVTKQDGAG